MWGKHFTDIQKKKMSEAQTGSKNHRYGCHFKHTDERKQKIREWVVAHPNKITKNTSIEIKIENELIKRGINYQKQVPLCKIARVDFYLPEFRIVIQADGCYWHGCPVHCQNKGIKCKEKDDRQDGVLTFNGFNVYRFWEHDINKSASDCIDSLNLNI
jgi:DNA mismatch endonuclease (patch repair protein)